MRSAARVIAVLGLVVVATAIFVWFSDHDWGLWLGALGAFICALGAIADYLVRKRESDN